MMAICCATSLSESIPCLGIEPAVNVARAAQAIGVQTRIAFFGKELARELAANGQIAISLLATTCWRRRPTSTILWRA